jgi:multidrug efflux pump subunit AcrA (membrane-fusion protein)
MLFSSCAESDVSDGGIALSEAVSVSYDTAVAKKRNIAELSQYEAYVCVKTEDVCFEDGVGALNEINVSIGDTVKKGELLASLDTAKTRQSIDTSRGSLDARVRRLEYDKTQKQLDIEIAMTELDDLETSGQDTEIEQKKLLIKKLEEELGYIVRAGDLEVSFMKAQLGKLEDSLLHSEIYAPFDGEIVNVCNVLPGGWISSSVAVVTVADPTELYVRYDGTDSISSSYISTALFNGKEYELISREYDRTEYIELVLSGKKPPALFSFKDDVSADIEAGDFVAILIQYSKSENALSVPSNSVYYDGGVSYVYIVSGGEKIYTKVACGLRTTAYTEILSGLTEGDVVFVKQ